MKRQCKVKEGMPSTDLKPGDQRTSGGSGSTVDGLRGEGWVVAKLDQLFPVTGRQRQKGWHIQLAEPIDQAWLLQ